MARMLSHQWSDKKPFTRRVRWYAEGLLGSERYQNVRLTFEDGDGVTHRTYGNNAATAEHDYQAFKTGSLGTKDLRP